MIPNISGLSMLTARPVHSNDGVVTESSVETIASVIPAARYLGEASATSGSKPENAPIVNRSAKPPGIWLNYRGGGQVWSREFEAAVSGAVSKFRNGEISSEDLIGYFEAKRGEIAEKRVTMCFEHFGIRRDWKDNKKKSFLLTPLCKSSPYGYALERILSLDQEKGYKPVLMPYVEEYISDQLLLFGKNSNVRYCFGVVMGSLEGKQVPLTHIIIHSLIKETGGVNDFGFEPFDFLESDDYIGENKESAIWLHTDPEQIKVVIPHVQSLVDRAVQGDLTVIPRIHWWYVHLAPTKRGSGGIAEMLTNTLCRLHGVELPGWANGIAPSVEVLVQPDEEAFCRNYHTLFESRQEELKATFSQHALPVLPHGIQKTD